ncbi:hypothetical protein DPMN_183159 [Dreissena polymorpha]|uniref:Uncharacterized protein n=1 Tax=Dreissena polymorpha TaxID=45954 RepID=A0A9D4DG74_DREPO|nr:hypothetical protein DPMN_183159 [Dreissena polymorpha]
MAQQNDLENPFVKRSVALYTSMIIVLDIGTYRARARVFYGQVWYCYCECCFCYYYCYFFFYCYYVLGYGEVVPVDLSINKKENRNQAAITIINGPGVGNVDIDGREMEMFIKIKLIKIKNFKINFGWAWPMWAGRPRIDRIVIRDVQYQLEVNRCRNEEVNFRGSSVNSVGEESGQDGQTERGDNHN